MGNTAPVWATKHRETLRERASTDTSLGLVLVTEAATNGSDFGAYTLGKAFLEGNFGLTKDPVRARFWLVKAAGECEFKHMSESGKANATRLLRELDAAE